MVLSMRIAVLLNHDQGKQPFPKQGKLLNRMRRAAVAGDVVPELNLPLGRPVAPIHLLLPGLPFCTCPSFLLMYPGRQQTMGAWDPAAHRAYPNGVLDSRLSLAQPWLLLAFGGI